MNKEITRRDFLRAAGALTAAVLVRGLIPKGLEGKVVEAGGNFPGYTIDGVPKDGVKDVLTVNVANGKFGGNYINIIGKGSEMMFAEPGTLLVGPEFPQEKIDKSGGAIERFSPANQDVFDTELAFTNVPEGGFLWVTGGYMCAEVDGKIIRLDGVQGHNWFLVIRGLFADGKQDSDKNRTIKFYGFAPGHTLWMRYPKGAFISENQLKQTAATSHTGATNCGAEGCSRLSVMMLDLNTGAYAVMRQEGINGEWQMGKKNWQE